MNPKSSAPGSFYRLTGPSDGARQRVESCPTTAGPWSLDGAARRASGGPAGPGDRGPRRRSVGRFTMDLLGPVPVGPLDVSASVVRPGRSVSLVQAALHDVTLDRTVATRLGVVVPDRRSPGPRTAGPPPDHGPSDGTERAASRGLERRLPRRGRVALDRRRRRQPGPGRGLDEASPSGRGRGDVTRAAAAGLRRLGVRGERRARRAGVGVPQHRADRARRCASRSASGSASTRPPPWARGRSASPLSTAYDEQGPVARSAQALLVQRR